MSWPLPFDYSNAIQNPKRCFLDPDLAVGKVETNKLGLPRPWAGNFAIVFHIGSNAGDWAARCFLRSQAKREERYRAITRHLTVHPLEWFAKFKYLDDGIKVKGKLFPIVKMAWLNGSQIDEYIRENIRNTSSITKLASQFISLLASLHEHNIAHGDLQHGNIMVVNGNLRLVDYDGMFVPGLENMPPGEIGHPNFQHPNRSDLDYGPNIDRFSAWVIYSSLLALAHEPDICRRFGALDGETLILSRSDLESPDDSEIMEALERSSNKEVHHLIKYLKDLSYFELLEIPILNKSTLRNAIARPTILVSEYDWIRNALRTGKVKEATVQIFDHINADSSWIISHLPRPSLKNFPINFIVERLSFALFSTLLLATIAILIMDILRFSQTDLALMSEAVTKYFFGIGLTVSMGSIIQIVGFGISLQRRYSSFEVVKKKELILEGLSNLEEEFQKKSDRIQYYVKEAVKIQNRLGKEKVGLKQKRDEAKSELKRKISDIDSKASIKQNSLQRRLSRLDQDKQQTIQQDLQKLRDNSIRYSLETSYIRNANIHGIGPKLTRRLESSGFRSAADIKTVRITASSWGRYTNDVAFIITTTGVQRRVNGIGPKKATSLADWHRNVSEHAKRRAPTNLPTEDLRKIESNYASMRNNIKLQIKEILPDVEAKKSKAKKDYKTIVVTLNKQTKRL